MSSYPTLSSAWAQVLARILQLEQEGLVTRTFRRLDADRQQAVLDAILAEAAETGPASLNIKRVAQRAGISVGSLYQYVGNRESLLAFATELTVRWTADLFEQYRPMLVALPLREALAAYLAGGLDWSQTQMGLVQCFGRAAYQGDPDLAERVVRPVADIMKGIVRDILTQAAQRGEIRPDVDLEATAGVLHALVCAVGDAQLLPYLNTYFQVTAESVSPERAAHALIELVVRGIGTTGAEA